MKNKKQEDQTTPVNRPLSQRVRGWVLRVVMPKQSLCERCGEPSKKLYESPASKGANWCAGCTLDEW